MQYQVYVRIELFESDSGKKVNWDDDTFYIEGDRARADALFDAIADGAGKASAEFTSQEKKP